MADATDTPATEPMEPVGKTPKPKLSVPGTSTPTVPSAVATTLEVTLSDALQKTLGEPGVNAYAVYFNKNVGGGPMWTELVSDGVVGNKGVTEIPLTDTVNGVLQPLIGGKVYFLVQSAGSGAADLRQVITQESDINWGNAEANDYRYDSFEVTLQGSPNDVGNLTSVNGFGLPMELKVDYTDGSSSKGYSIPAKTLFDKLDEAASGSVDTYSDGPLKGDNRAAVSPTTSVAEGFDDYQASDWLPYLDDLKSADGIVISGFFNGAPDANQIWHNSGFYAYALEWDGTHKVFWLRAQDSSQIKGDIRLTEDDLANSIYSTLGNVGVYAPGSDTPYQIFNHASVNNSTGAEATMNTGENNQWGAVLEQFLTGFTAGYYGVEGQSLNPLDDTPIDLSQNWNWDPTYAFGENMAQDPSTKSAYVPTFFDHYSQVFFDISNSYGSGYSDGLMAQYNRGDPLISVSEPGTSQNVPKISLTLFDDDETPEGYVAPEIDNYIAPDAGGYVTAPAGTTNTSGASVGLNLANAGMVLKGDTPITLDFLVSGDGSSAADWQSVTITPDDATPLWQNWKIDVDANGDYKAVASGTDTPPGSLLITNYPGMEAGVHWSRITIGENEASKTFNLYTTTDGTNFLNPAYDGQSGALAIDGLATIAPQASTASGIPTFTIDFLRSSSSTLPSELLTINTDLAPDRTPTAPVVGTLDGTTFTALSGQGDKINTSATATSAEVAFGWTGLNNSKAASASVSEWIDSYSNKVGALNYAQISTLTGAGAAVPFLTTRSDLDGQWMTEAKALGNGTYTVTMTEFLPGTNDEMIPIGAQSSPLTLTVDVAEKPLALAQGGRALKIANDSGPDVAGNWVRIGSAEAPQVAGAAVAVVLTDAKGALIHAETGATGGVSVEDAKVLTLGALALPDGGEALHGMQSLYLPTEARLGFVSLDADGNARGDLAVATPESDGGARVEVGGHVLDVDVDNTLSDAAQLADAQRETCEPFVFVRTGQKIRVDLAGDAEGGNRLGFVKVDIDDDGGWSVGGVGQDEAGFDATLRANLDGGFSMRGAGNFRDANTWTVAGETGFYAPVVLTDTGEVLFAPAENGDEGDGDSVRVLGQSFFAFEDGAGSRDFDDISVRLTPVSEGLTGRLEGEADVPLVVQTAAAVRAGDRFVSSLPDVDGGAFGVTVLPDEAGSSRLLVNGEAIFRGDSGVRMQGPGGIAVIGEDGILSLAGDGTVLSLDTGTGTLVNQGLIRGDIGFGAGDDIARGPGRYNGEIRMRQGNDSFAGGAGDDVVLGGAGADELRGWAGDDTLTGGTGADVLIGGRGMDELRGGPGFDVLKGGIGADELRGGRGADTLNGGPGDDRLFGGRGADLVEGGTGDDLLMGGIGADDLRGGKGDDTIWGGARDDVMRGEQGADYLLGGRGNDILLGGSGDDVLRGGRGADTLNGGPGDDRLIGGLGADLLAGGPGDDVLIGGRGDNVLLGGSGSDVFVMHIRNGNDRIGDFDLSSDTLDLTDYGLDPDTGMAQVLSAMEELPDGSTLLDLSDLGGAGSVRFNGLALEDAPDIFFLF